MCASSDWSAVARSQTVQRHLSTAQTRRCVPHFPNCVYTTQAHREGVATTTCQKKKRCNWAVERCESQVGAARGVTRAARRWWSESRRHVEARFHEFVHAPRPPEARARAAQSSFTNTPKQLLCGVSLWCSLGGFGWGSRLFFFLYFFFFVYEPMNINIKNIYIEIDLCYKSKSKSKRRIRRKRKMEVTITLQFAWMDWEEVAAIGQHWTQAAELVEEQEACFEEICEQYCLDLKRFFFVLVLVFQCEIILEIFSILLIS